jgi:flagellin
VRLGFGASAGLDAMRRTRDLLLGDWARLGSGRRLARSGDDAAGLAIATQMRAAERSIAQGARNLADGVSLARTAEGALATTSDALVRMRELAVAAGNGALGAAERAAIQAEYDALAQEITRISDATAFGQRLLLDGSLAVGVADGTGNAIALSVGDQSAHALGVDGLDAADPDTLDALDSALASVARARGDLGALESRLESGIRSLSSHAAHLAASRSRIEDTDYAESSSDFARHALLSRAQIATAARAHQLRGALLALLR